MSGNRSGSHCRAATFPPAFRSDYKKSPPLNFRGGDFLFSPRKPSLQTASNLNQVSEPSVQLILLLCLNADEASFQCVHHAAIYLDSSGKSISLDPSLTVTENPSFM